MRSPGPPPDFNNVRDILIHHAEEIAGGVRQHGEVGALGVWPILDSPRAEPDQALDLDFALAVVNGEEVEVHAIA